MTHIDAHRAQLAKFEEELQARQAHLDDLGWHLQRERKAYVRITRELDGTESSGYTGTVLDERMIMTSWR